MAKVEELRAAVNELRDIEAIKTLKARYCHLVDGRRWDELAELWSEDATCDYGFFGSYEGREEIVNGFFRDTVDSVSSFMVHMVHNPLVDVQGDSASGTWYLTAQTTIQPPGQAVWVMGIYRDRFRRIGGEWKLTRLEFEFKYYTPFEDGWAKTPMWEVPSSG
jgi:hypothetical protein